MADEPRGDHADVFRVGAPKPGAGRSNLIIRPDATLDRLLIDERRVLGVRLVSGEEVRARRTVLAAGSIGSDAILMRSGIVPGRDLPRSTSSPSLTAPDWAHTSSIMRRFQFRSIWFRTLANV
jgi:choline dehydrogenase-like flavoprotein